MNAIIDELRLWAIHILGNIPGRTGTALRHLLFSPFFKVCGAKVSFSTHTVIIGFRNIHIGNNFSSGPYLRLYASGNADEKIVIGDDVSINEHVMINADFSGEINIGNHVLIGPNVMIRSSNHRYEDKSRPIKSQGHKKGYINIEDDVWISANATILPDVTLEKGAVVSAGAVVTKDIEPYTVVGGVPARPIMKRT